MVMLFEVLVELLPEALAAVCTPLGRFILRIGTFGLYKGGTSAGEALEVLVGIALCGVALVVVIGWILQGNAG